MIIDTEQVEDAKQTDTSFDSTIETDSLDLEQDGNLIVVAIPFIDQDDLVANENIGLLQQIKRFLCQTLIEDERCLCVGRFKVLESIETVRILKFSCASVVSIIAWHVLVRKIGWEHDDKYFLRDFISFDLGAVALDSLAFAILSRLYQRDGVDRISFFFPMVISTIFASWSTEIWCMHRAHIGSVWAHHIPLYSGWDLYTKVFRNNDAEWWSQIAMALCWGQYVNGIAVWGRDSVLTCEYASYVTAGNGCNYSSTNDS
eukprot:scaffold588_cov282-Chaetoceros_neogracile.AAC.10